MTRRLSLLLATLAAIPAAVLAQGSTSIAAPAAAPANPISSSQNKMYTLLSSVVIAAAEKMPEEHYSFRPTPEVRSFGQLVGHLADSQYFFCSSVAGETKPRAGSRKARPAKGNWSRL